MKRLNEAETMRNIMNLTKINESTAFEEQADPDKLQQLETIRATMIAQFYDEIQQRKNDILDDMQGMININPRKLTLINKHINSIDDYKNKIKKIIPIGEEDYQSFLYEFEAYYNDIAYGLEIINLFFDGDSEEYNEAISMLDDSISDEVHSAINSALNKN